MAAFKSTTGNSSGIIKWQPEHGVESLLINGTRRYTNESRETISHHTLAGFMLVRLALLAAPALILTEEASHPGA